MRTSFHFLATVLTTSAGLVLAGAGCADESVCDVVSCVDDDGGVDGGPMDGGSREDATDAEGGGAADSGPQDAASEAEAAPPTCDLAADPKDDPTLCVADSVGVFVDPTHGLDSSPGTKEQPFKSIGKAVASGKSRAYLCAGTYAETVTVTGGVSLYGGWSCSDWSYATSNAVVVAPSAAGTALTLTGVAGVNVEDLEVDALPGTASAPSSVAALVASSTGVTFRRVTLKAGAALSATAPTGTTNWTATKAPAGQGPMGTTGGLGGVSACTDGTAPAGGNGGAETLDGKNGTPPNAAGGTGGYDGAPGKGGTTGCGVGADPGANGSPSTTAAAGAATWGTLTSTGWTPTDGASGANGGPGQGGGGAGGEKHLPRRRRRRRRLRRSRRSRGRRGRKQLRAPVLHEHRHRRHRHAHGSGRRRWSGRRGGAERAGGR